MPKFTLFIPSKEKREIITWIGGGILLLVSGIWAVFLYFYPTNKNSNSPASSINASAGGIAIGGNITNSNINTDLSVIPNNASKSK